MSPVRIQLRRTKGWKLPPDTVRCARPGHWGNPFRVGGYFMVGDPGTRGPFKMAWCESYAPDVGFTLIETRAQAVEFYRRLMAGWPAKVNAAKIELAGKDLACFCPLDQPCHVDVLLELANAP